MLISILLFSGFLVMLDPIWNRVWNGPTSVWEWASGIALFLGPVLGLVWLLWRAQRGLRRLVRSRAGAVCTECGYDLTGCDETGKCPECGEAYSVEGLRKRWTHAGVL